jgi:hypothetical protein
MAVRPGRILLSIVALVTSCGCFVANWNASHIYNPLWTPHAKFHNGLARISLLLRLSTCVY